jgi:hypothetical protein
VRPAVIARIVRHTLVIGPPPPFLKRSGSPTVRGVKSLAGIVVFALPAAWLTWTAVRVLRAPKESWARGRSRWIAVVPLRQGERPPSASELRFWASVWLIIAAAILALGLAIGFSQ